MPRLQINGEAAIASRALIHISGSIVKDTEHRHDTIRRAVRATDARATGTDIAHVEADATRVL